MPDLLVELFSEEIPARMQARAREDLRKMVTEGLVAAGLTYGGAHALSTPRRLTLAIEGVTAASRAVREERKGPAVNAPEQAATSSVWTTTAAGSAVALVPGLGLAAARTLPDGATALPLDPPRYRTIGLVSMDTANESPQVRLAKRLLAKIDGRAWGLEAAA